MRFDDRLATLLSENPEDGTRRARLWAQLADICAQPSGENAGLRATAFDRLEHWRHELGVETRRRVAASVGRRGVPADLVRFFAQDLPHVAAPVLLRATLADEHWAALIHGLPPSSRNLLRQRQDLPADAIRVLALYQQADLILPTEKPAERAESGTIEIRDLVARIEAYRHNREAAPPVAVEPVRRFHFESDAEGAIQGVDRADGAALIGMRLGEAAEGEESGVDSAVARGFTARAKQLRGQLHVAGAGPAAGDWFVRAKPVFDREGRFAGHRGVASRDEPFDAAPRGLLADGPSPETVRQLLHELRTPLNAIRGFAEMITGQYLGPVAASYRERTAAIARDAARLADTIDDLDFAARLDMDDYRVASGAGCDTSQLVRKVAQQLREEVAAAKVGLRISAGVATSPARCDEGEGERLLARLLRFVIGGAGEGETLELSIADGPAGVEIGASLPLALRGLSPDQLRAAALPAASALVPLGHGFSFRLVEELARAATGTVTVAGDRLLLTLPAAAAHQPRPAAHAS